MDDACKQTEPLPIAPMLNPAFAPGQWPPHVKTCCECGGEIKNDTYVVRQTRIFCDGCAATVED